MPAAQKKPPPPPLPAPSPTTNGMSDVCCVPEEALQASACLPTGTAPRPPPPAGPVEVRLGILTVSDRASKGLYDDASGPEIERCMQDFASGVSGAGWRLTVARRAIVADEPTEITRELQQWTDRGPLEDAGKGNLGVAACNLILTTGGTGLSPRDVTPDVTASLLDRHAPGIPELLLRESLKHEPLAALSRATAGVRAGTLIINLPGRPKAVRENLTTLMPILGHALIALES